MQKKKESKNTQEILISEFIQKMINDYSICALELGIKISSHKISIKFS